MSGMARNRAPSSQDAHNDGLALSGWPARANPRGFGPRLVANARNAVASLARLHGSLLPFMPQAGLAAGFHLHPSLTAHRHRRFR